MTTTTPGVPLKSIASVMVFDNFNVAAFENGKQIPDIQDNLLILWASLAASNGYDPTSAVIQSRTGAWRIFKTENGYNLESA